MDKVYLNKIDFEKDNNINLPYSDDVSALSKKDTIKGRNINNRLVCQAMEGCDGTKDGVPDILTKRRYKRLAEGGSAMIWFEATAVMPEARANPRQLYICDENIDEFKKQVEDIKNACLQKNGFEPIVIMQATHSGRYSKPNGYPQPLIAYNNPIFEKDNPISKENIVTDDYIDRVKDSLVYGAELAQKAGFDGVDIKCCHRYLNSELLSAYNREGKYGGSLENRTRLLRESIKGSIESCSNNFIVSSRLNIYDGFEYPYGFGVKEGNGIVPDFEEPIWLVRELYNMGVELLNVTMGNPYFNPHVNRPFSKGAYEPGERAIEGVSRILEGTKIVKKAVPQMKIISSGLSFLGVCAPNVAAAYIDDGTFDYAGFGRTIFAYPDFANDILNKGKMICDKCCIACSKCTEIMRSGGTPGCVIKDKDVYLDIYKKYCGGNK